MNHNQLVAAFALLFLPFDAGCNSLKRFGYEGFRRDGWQHPEEVVRVLGLKAGDTVADLGAGGGYFTFRLADAVGKAGAVYAVDVDPGMIDYLTTRARGEGYANVHPLLVGENDPGLPADGVDLIFTCNTYHHLSDRPAYFARVKQYLRPGGRIAIIDHEHKGFFARLFGHATADDVVRREMENAGYRLEQHHTFLPRQNFMVFTPSGA
jgi:predicted methyltransferase